MHCNCTNTCFRLSSFYKVSELLAVYLEVTVNNVLAVQVDHGTGNIQRTVQDGHHIPAAICSKQTRLIGEAVAPAPGSRISLG